MERLRLRAMRVADARRTEGPGSDWCDDGYCRGHVSLVRVAKGQAARGGGDDLRQPSSSARRGFEKYRGTKRDLAALDAAGVDAVYLPA